MNAELDSLRATELRLGLPGTDGKPQMPPPPAVPRPASKRTLDDDRCPQAQNPAPAQESTRVAKARVVGWPPVRSYRKNAMKTETSAAAAAGGGGGGGLFVKVSMDGAPYLRKIDLRVYEGYKELREGLEAMFKCFEGSKGGLDLAITYEDKDGDLMLVGDVPWEMFTCSCKKLRIIRGSETIKGSESSHHELQKTSIYI